MIKTVRSERDESDATADPCSGRFKGAISLTMTDHTPRPCPVCDDTEISVFLRMGEVPCHCNLLLPTRPLALKVPKGPIQLGFCRSCGHIFNLLFDPLKVAYSGCYENALHCSKRFQRYARGLAERLIREHDLRNKRIIEIGCGDGHFLHLLCTLGDNQGVGFDPSHSAKDPNREKSPKVQLIRDHYCDRYAQERADFFCCRHVLEHLQNPLEFVGLLRRQIGSDFETGLFFEVPNGRYMLQSLSVWDIIYEHCAYYSCQSLAHLFSRCDFEVSRVKDAFEGQFLTLEAKPSSGDTSMAQIDCERPQQMEGDVEDFEERYRKKLQLWQERLAEGGRHARKVVLWGAGSKGVTFLNLMA